jgi:Domain of unknown function (DUF4276)
MSIAHWEVLVEEASMEQLLRVLMPRMVGRATFAIHAHQGKHHLMARLSARLRGYARWLPAEACVLVVVDRDDQDCHALKRRLDGAAAGIRWVTGGPVSGAVRVLNRIAIEELEAWYFGDWAAVRAAYPGVAGNLPRQRGYRDPDLIQGGTWEAFERVLQRAGYFSGGLRKIEAAQTIAKHMDPARNTSPSFRALRDALGAHRLT